MGRVVKEGGDGEKRGKEKKNEKKEWKWNTLQNSDFDSIRTEETSGQEHLIVLNRL